LLQLGRLPVRVTVLAVAILATAAGGSWFAMNHDRASGSAAAGRHATTGQNGSGQATQAAAVPLQVVSVTPARHTQHVNGAAPVTIAFSAPLAPDSPARINARAYAIMRRAIASAAGNLLMRCFART